MKIFLTILILVLNCSKNNKISLKQKMFISLELIASLIKDADNKFFEEALERAEDINAYLADGNTLLHLVASLNDLEKISILLRKGAKVLLKNKKGAFPVNVVKNGLPKCEEIKKLLKEYSLREELEIAIEQKENEIIDLLLNRIEPIILYKDLLIKVIDNKLFNKRNSLELLKKYFGTIKSKDLERLDIDNEFIHKINNLLEDHVEKSLEENSKKLSYLIKKEFNNFNISSNETSLKPPKLEANSIDNLMENRGPLENNPIPIPSHPMSFQLQLIEENLKFLDNLELPQNIAQVLENKNISIQYKNSKGNLIKASSKEDIFLSRWKTQNLIQDEIIIYKEDDKYYISSIYPIDFSYVVELFDNEIKVASLKLNVKNTYVEEKNDPESWNGLCNLGNTCYLNSAVKALASLKSINNLLSNEKLFTYTSLSDERKDLLKCFKALLMSIRKGLKFSNEQLNNIIIQKFIKSFNYISQRDGQNKGTKPFLIKGNFMDVNEFLIFLMTFVDNFDNKPGRVLERIYSNFSPINDFRETSLNNLLILNFSANLNSIQELLNISDYSTLATIDFNNDPNAKKYYFIKEAPNFLIIQLKRFRNDETKIENKIVLSKEIIINTNNENVDIRNIIDTQQTHKYKLRATVEHIGPNLQGYHYICYTFLGDKVVKHDDINVEKVDNFKESKETYLLFYEKE